MIIDDINEPSSFELDDEAIKHIQNFRNKLSNEGVVSRNEVLAVETFIGNDFITKVVNPNKLTMTRGVNQVEEICGVIDTQLEKVQQVSNVTYESLVENVQRAERNVKNVINYLTMGLTIDTSEDSLIGKLNNKEIRCYFNNEDELVDLIDADIAYVIRNHSDYIEKVFGENKVEMLLRIKWEAAITLPLLSTIKSNSFSSFTTHPDIVISEITLRDIIKIIENPGLYIKDLKILKDYINWDIIDIRDNSKWFVSDVKSLNKTYNRYKMLNEIIEEDKASLSILAATYNK